MQNSCPGMSVTLFEFDRRFARYGSDFTYYDYNYPQNLDDKFAHFFDIVVADPPYLSKECIEKMSQTLRFLSKDCERFPMLLLTGAMQQNHASRLLNVHPCGFRPVHHKKLGNEFKLYTNYDPLDRLGGWEHKATSSKD
ncbi:hypothetical protein O6H91_18G025900 [Diphasiastrum complanatum]|uniref:Uncharacterized protein n=1 Tax=Diphasiastrum complanatum TaxID=34168 RepID=A0ACC2AZ35_DIPCM|nr:hypothetical protein O6H91_18G025900 [Diphasiastrum complanatum]